MSVVIKKGSVVRYLKDVASPPHLVGNKGDEKTVGVDINRAHARYLANGLNPYVEVVQEQEQKPNTKRTGKTNGNDTETTRPTT